MKKKIIVVLIIVIIIIIFCFMCKYDEFINLFALLRTNAIVIGAFAGIGTLISSIIAILTIYEVKRQREHTYKPDIYLDSYSARIYPIEYWKENQFFLYKRGYYNEREVDSDEIKNIYLTYILTNIGFGVAKTITCEWEYDVDTAVKVLQQMLPVNFSIKNTFKGYVIKKDDQYLGFLYPGDIKSQHTDFILPESVRSNKKFSSIPHFVTLVFTYYLVFKYTLYNPDPENEFLYEDFPNLPQLKLKLTYYDLARKKHFKMLNIKFIACGTLKEGTIKVSEDNDFGIFIIEVSEL